MAWDKEQRDIPLGNNGYMIGPHTVTVVPLEPPLDRATGSLDCTLSISKVFDISGWAPECPWGGTQQSIRRRSLQLVAQAWQRMVPGLTIEFVIKDPVPAPRSVCSDSEVALAIAKKHAPEVDIDKDFQHLAAIADCGGGAGNASLTKGKGTIWMQGWAPRLIAHEFGHNLHLMHSNSLTCSKNSEPHPDSCQQVIYGDHEDVMGAPRIGTADGLRGVFSIAGMGLFGSHRAVLLGANPTALSSDTHIKLSRQGGGTQSRPLLIDSAIGPLLLDANSTGTLQPLGDGNMCPELGVTLRAATSAGFSDFVSNQATLTVMSQLSGPTSTPDFLDAFRLPGTGFAAILSSLTKWDVTLSVIAREAAGNPPRLARSDIKVRLTGRGYKIVFPRSKATLGYFVEGEGLRCPRRVVAGATLTLKQPPTEISIRAISMNGIPSAPLKLQLIG